MQKKELIQYTLLAVAGAALALFAAFAPDWFGPVWISTVYKPFSRTVGSILTRMTGWLPFSVAESLLYIGMVTILTALGWTAIQIFRRKKPLRSVYRLTASLLFLTGMLFFLFSALWGANYSSLPLAEELSLEVGQYSVEVLYRAAESFVDTLNGLAGEVPRDTEGISSFGSFSELSREAAESWGLLVLKEDAFGGVVPGRPKYVLMSEAMSYAGITGIFIPFTYEANINASAPDSSLPFTMAHELAHAAGVGPEKEANFAAFLACRESTDPRFQYSGYLAAFIYAYNALVREDQAAAAELWYKLDPQIVADLLHRSQYWKKYEGQVNAVATKVNNTYLMAMNQAEGVKSYGMVVDLLLAEYVRTNGNPDVD